MDSSGRIALVTGASRGIGQAIAARLQQDGFTVVGTATGESGLAAIRERGQLAYAFAAGQTDATALIQQIESEQGSIGVLVNNAGMTLDGLLMRLRDEDIERVLQVNLLSAMQLSRLVIRGMMKARQGRIINISSVVAGMGNAGQTAYVASKAGLEGFTRALAHEMGSRQITVNAVAPGFIETDMTASLTAEQQAAMLQGIALGRIGQAADVAAAVAFLASPAAGYITGAVLPVNGGLYMG